MTPNHYYLPNSLLVLTSTRHTLVLIPTLILSLLLLLLLDHFFAFLPTLSPAHNRRLPGPAHHSFLHGHHPFLHSYEPLLHPRAWRKEHGLVYQIRVLYGLRLVMVQDPTAIRHMLTRPNLFPKPDAVKKAFGDAFGKGLLAAEGEDHARQRRILTPAFSARATRRLVPVFCEVAMRLVDKWAKIVDDAEGQATFNVLPDLGLFALDALGKAGFGMDFNTLQSVPHRFLPFIQSLGPSAAPPSYSARSMLRALWNTVTSLGRDSADKINEAAKAKKIKMQREADDMIRERREELAMGKEDGEDLLTLMIKSSLEEKEKYRLTDEELLGQMITIIFGGLNTSSASMAWALHLLSEHQHVQNKLRTEVRTVLQASRARDSPHLTEEDLDSITYLDHVTRESLRLRPPVAFGMLSPAKRCSVPLSRPITLRNGEQVHELVLEKGTFMLINRCDLNTTEEVWGEDGTEFRPERWDDELTGAEGGLKSASAWSNISTFSGGPKSCIGYRFALQEYKAVLALLVDAFEFIPSGDRIEGRSNVITRPIVVGEEKKGWQLPMTIRRAPT